MQQKNKENGKDSEKNPVELLRGSIDRFAQNIEDGFVYPLIIFPHIEQIDEDALFRVYADLKKIGKQQKMHVLLYSYGGDAHTAFHIARLLQDYAYNDLYIYVLREAKSAATLISCAADKIVFTEISELGPMDPQIRLTMSNERFSPLAIKHTFDLLQQQSNAGHEEIVTALTNKLPDPLILGEHLKSLDTGKDYLTKLLSSRMFNDDYSKAAEIANELVSGYPDHNYCIDYQEAQNLGLNIDKATEETGDNLFSIMERYKLISKKFENHLTRARNTEDQDEKDKENNEALKIYEDVTKLAESIIESQKDRESNLNNEAK